MQTLWSLGFDTVGKGSKMLLNVLSRGVVLTDSMRAAVQRKLDFALDRFGDRLDRVEVTIEDVNGPRGGVDKRVRLLLSGPVRRGVVIDERGDNVMAVMSSAANRASQVLGRIVERKNRQAHRAYRDVEGLSARLQDRLDPGG